MSLYVDIQKKLGDFSLNVTVSAEKGVLGLLGSSGCGKSLTLRCIAGIEKPDRGVIRLDGQTCYDSVKWVNLRPQKRRVGMMFQNYALFPNMTVEQNLLCGIERGKERQKRLAELMERFQLTELRALRPGQLSGGQQQRTALARCLGGNPSVLLLDEPFSALDTHLKNTLQLQLREQLNAFDGTAVLVTHDRDEAYLLCDHIAIMDGGKILTVGETREVFRNPVTAAAARLTGCKNVISARKVGEYTVFVPEWGGMLTVSQPVPAELTAIGIRAHDLLPVGAPGENTIELTGGMLTEYPFEWNALLRTPSGGTVHWKAAKSHIDGGGAPPLPQFLYIPPERVLLLR